MKSFAKLIFCLALILSAGNATAQNSGSGNDVFVPIAKYIARGDVQSLSAWFADNLEMSVISKGGNSSRAQARQILQNFFDTYTPRNFEIAHTASDSNMKYALGTLNAGGENFLVTIFVSAKGGSNHIRQLKVERLQ